MHIAEGFLPASHCVGWALASAPCVIYGAVAVKRQLRDNPQSSLLLAAAGAFTFVLSALKIPSVTGSSSHPTGTGLGAVLFRPPVMALLGSIVLLFQALLLAHGGITTLGANIFSMAIVGPWVGYGVWRLVRACGGSIGWAMFAAALTADVSTYIVTAFQLAAAHHAGGLGQAVVTFLALYAPTQVPLAIVEALMSVVIFRALRTIAPAEIAELHIAGLDPSCVLPTAAPVQTSDTPQKAPLK